ncbi:MAG: type II toxin-antitoxin system HicB family antitoxin [Bauldia sp.]|nr:type II toxin-antitoxin system HicB family antitoxin [Bauldia sp.]
MGRLDYPVVIQPLADEDGGGFLALAPDLPGCVSDGDTPEQALANIRDAIESWLSEARELGREIPQPSHGLVAAE